MIFIDKQKILEKELKNNKDLLLNIDLNHNKDELLFNSNFIISKYLLNYMIKNNITRSQLSKILRISKNNLINILYNNYDLSIRDILEISLNLEHNENLLRYYLNQLNIYFEEKEGK